MREDNRARDRIAKAIAAVIQSRRSARRCAEPMAAVSRVGVTGMQSAD